MAKTEGIHIFGIRHHGPGSARSLRAALEALHPDVILVEGPPDAQGVLPLLVHEAMEPPVALLIYAPDRPQRAVHYPFAVFSPEWQALQYGLGRGIPVRFMDLPQAHCMALESQAEASEGDAAESSSQGEDGAAGGEDDPAVLGPGSTLAPGSDGAPGPGEVAVSPEMLIRADPLGWLAQAAGYSDGERWWEQMVEQRHDSTDLFAAILEAMTALRAELPPIEAGLEAQREAWMRQTIRAAQREGFARIAVVCGAWHGPALATMPPAKQDSALLKGLPKIKVEATWMPWNYGRLSFDSGYGAGVASPGWYHHLWECAAHPLPGSGDPATMLATRWMAHVARLLRHEDLDASAAHIIESVRLAETLAAMRGRATPGLDELNEATQTVLCFGSEMPMRLIHQKLIVSERLGRVPDETPMIPLQRDLLREQKRLRLDVSAENQTLELDLRKPLHLERSQLLHRLNLMNIAWGTLRHGRTGKGTFHENWGLKWSPELTVAVIDAGTWGNTVLDAAVGAVRHGATQAVGSPAPLPALTRLLNRTILAELPDAVSHLMQQIQEQAALASDVAHLMEALPALVNVQRYGNVRKSDTGMIGGVVAGLVARICIGLPAACASLNDDAANEMFNRVVAVNNAIGLLQNEGFTSLWQGTLRRLSQQGGLHGLIAGRAVRILFDMHVFDAEEGARAMGLALSAASEPAQAAAWVEGFLKQSGEILLYDEGLWVVLDRWVAGISKDVFPHLLPLLRRTFATFPTAARRQLGERARRGAGRVGAHGAGSRAFDADRAAAVLPLLEQLLGVSGV